MATRMKIAHVTPVYPPYKGGMGAVAKAYVNAQREQGHDVDVFHPKNTPTVFSFGNAAIVPALLWKLKGYDVIHLHYPFYGAALFTALAAFRRKQRLVVTYHMFTTARDWRGWIFRAYRWLVEPFVLRLADVVLCSSTDYAQAVGLKHRQLIELPFWIDTQRFLPGEEAALRTELGMAQDACLFLAVAGLDAAHDFKGIPELMKATALLDPEEKSRVVIVGDGALRETYEQLAVDYAVQDQVQFVGRISDEQLPQYYRAADVHVFPSTAAGEAFGLVTLEAATSGTPSIVSDLPGVRTLVDDGKTGMVIPVNDVRALAQAMQWMVDHPEERQAMGNAAHERSQRYKKDLLVTRLSDVYEGRNVESV